jgi:anti-sigma regulatory factor (Ser/Thr protein kinase)
LTGQTADDAAGLCGIPEDHWTIEPVAAGVAQARRRAVTAAGCWCPEPLPDSYADTIRRVVSELVTNAIRHAGQAGPINISLCATAKGNLLVAVEDGSAEPPIPRDPYDGGGYGLAVVAAEAITWGWRPHGRGKTVMATIALPHSKTRPRHCEGTTVEHGRATPTIPAAPTASARHAELSAA